MDELIVTPSLGCIQSSAFLWGCWKIIGLKVGGPFCFSFFWSVYLNRRELDAIFAIVLTLSFASRIVNSPFAGVTDYNNVNDG